MMNYNSELPKHLQNLTESQAWEILEKGARIMTTPGLLQYEMIQDKQWGPIFEESRRAMLHLLADLGEFKMSDESLQEFTKLFIDNRNAQVEFMTERLGDMSVAMQILEPDQMIMRAKKLEDIDGLSPADIKKLREEQGDTPMGVQLHPHLMAIMSAGIKASGGQQEFVKVQAEVVASIPKELRAQPHVYFAAQMIGAVSKAVIDRLHSREMTTWTINAILETHLAAKKAICLGLVTQFSASPEDMAQTLAMSIFSHIKEKSEVVLHGKSEVVREQQAEDDGLKATFRPEQDRQPPHQPKQEDTTQKFGDAKPNSFFTGGNGTVN